DNVSSTYERLEKDDATDTNDDNFQDFINKQKEVITTSYQQGKQYTNIIVLGGYAGIFAIWNLTKEHLLHWHVFTVGLCILASIFMYVAIEVYGGWLRATQVKSQIKELQEAEALHKFPDEYGKREKERVTTFLHIWPYFF